MELTLKLPDLATMPGYENEPRDSTKKVEFDLTEGNLSNFFRNREISQDLPWVQKVFHYSRFLTSWNEPDYSVYKGGGWITQTDAVESYKNYFQREIDELINRPALRPLQVGQYDRGMDLPTEQVGNSFEALGIVEKASAYLRKKVKVDRVFLHVATPDDQNPYQFFQDSPYQPKWTNAHFDPKLDTMKAIVYLESTYQRNGAFHYMPYSNEIKRDPMQNVFSRAISTGSYCHNPESRSSVFKLPANLRCSANFGRMALPETKLESWLDLNMTPLTSSDGNIIVFDPNGIHQGGVVKEGRRVCLQVLMR